MRRSECQSLEVSPVWEYRHRCTSHQPGEVFELTRTPDPRGFLATGPYSDPASLLSASKRGLESYADKLGSWSELFNKTSGDLRDAGMDVKQTRYTLWLLEKYRYVYAWLSWSGISPLLIHRYRVYRQGHDPATVAVASTPKKTVRKHPSLFPGVAGVAGSELTMYSWPQIRGWGPKVQNGKRVR